MQRAIKVFVALLLFSLPAFSALVEDPIRHEALTQQAATHQVSLPQKIPLPKIFGMAGNAFVNGEFDAGLSAWVSSGSVQSVSQEAILGDADSPDAMLYQAVALTAGVYTISFDFSSGLSSNNTQGNFPDTFFASLYFVDDLNQLDIAGSVFDDATGLMDMDPAGVFNNAGVVGPSVKGTGWLNFSHTFNLAYDYVAIAFELAGLNGTSGDSSMSIDNVSIVMVPEPGTIALVMGGLLVLVYRRRFR